jgi:hypothetical protein
MRDGQTGVPRNARFFGKRGRNDLYVGRTSTVVPARFEPASQGADVGWLVPLQPLDANASFTLQGQTFTTGDGFDTTPPSFSGVRSAAYTPSGCGDEATRLLQALGYSDEGSELDSGVVMKIRLRRQGDATERTILVAAQEAVIGAFENRAICDNVAWEDQDAELVAIVTLIDLAGNESAPSEEIRFRLDFVAGPDAGCAAGGGPPAAPFAAVVGALLACRRRRRGTPAA